MATLKMVVFHANAMARVLLSVKIAMRERLQGRMIQAPIACMVRDTTSRGKVGERPQHREPMRKMTMPHWKRLIKCTTGIMDWGLTEDGTKQRESILDKIAENKEIAVNLMLLTAAVEDTKKQVGVLLSRPESVCVH